MANIIFITGGQRSGKSSFAQRRALELSQNPIYLATSRVWDTDFEHRIKRHQSDRGPRWQTIEEEKLISQADIDGKTVVLDCITLWLTNFFYDAGYNAETALKQAKAEWGKTIVKKTNLLVVSNEIGMGLHAESEAGRNFTDLQGWMNQHIASTANQVYFMVSGIPVKIK